MKKIISTVLATMLILSSVSFTMFGVSADSTGKEIVIQASNLTGVLSSWGVKAAAKTQLIAGNADTDDITAVKVNPDPCEDRKPYYGSECAVILESYPTSLGITPATYKYARITYKYIPADNDTNTYEPYIQFRTIKKDFNSFKSADALKSNEWSYFDFDLSAVEYENDDAINQLRIFAFGDAVGTLVWKDGTLDSSKYVVANPDSSLYIANVAFFTEKPGVPTITGISFAAESANATRGKYIAVPDVTISGVYSPIVTYNVTLSGHSSKNTYLSSDGATLYIGEDEEADKVTLTAISVVNPEMFATLTVNIADPAPRTKFDADNVILRFGVASDVHQNGYYNGNANSKLTGEWAHLIESFQKMAGTAENGGSKLDALLINGDFVDGIANGGSNVGSFNAYGTKAIQNMREVSHVAQGLWGKDTTVEFTETKKIPNGKTSKGDSYVDATSVTGYGVGLDDNTKFFYVLGNHDENGEGKTDAYTRTNDGASTPYSPVYSADYFAAIFCGWQYNPDSEEALANSRGGNGTYDDGHEMSYRSYIADLIDYKTNKNTTVTKETFEAAYGVKFETATALFDKYFGHLDSETTLTNEHGLRYGNQHMTIDPNPDNGTTDDQIHFIGIELSMTEASCKWAEEIIKQSVAEDPGKPIFMLTHFKHKGTMLGDEGRSTNLQKILKNYPQVIIWGGHSHTALQSDAAINSELGFVAVESATNRYLDTATSLTLSSKFGKGSTPDSSHQHTAYNYPTHENGNYASGCYVEVDNQNNVRINRVDLYRSYSADYAADASVYSGFSGYDTYSTYEFKNEYPATNEPVFIREPWDITDIGTGEHLADFNTSARTEKNATPYFESNDSLSAEPAIGGIKVNMTLNAKDDGMVYVYVLEVYDSEDNLAERRYYTNYFYEYPQEAGKSDVAGNDIKVLNYTDDNAVAINGLSPATEYTVKLYAVDDFYVAGDPIETTVTTLDGDTKVTLEDGRIAVFVDTTGTNSTYTWTDNKEYLVYGTFAAAIATQADVIYFIKGTAQLAGDVINIQKKNLEIIGVANDRTETVLSYSSSVGVEKYNITLTNIGLNKTAGGDLAFYATKDCTITLNDVVATNNPLNIFMGGFSNAAGGNLVVTGETGPIAKVYTGVSSWQLGHHVGGDIDVTLKGGTYNETVGDNKNQTGNYIDGNITIIIEGGTYGGTVAIGSESENSAVKKNAVLKIFAGDFSKATIGRTTNKTTVSGKDVIITTKEIANSANAFNKASNGIVIYVPEDSTNAVGEASYDDNGYLTSFAIVQVEGKASYVNGEPATEIVLKDGEIYEITYKTPAAFEFDLNGGKGVTPEPLKGTVGNDVSAKLPTDDNFSKQYHSFLGWSLNKDATAPDTEFVISAEGSKLYAVWQPWEQYTITLDAKGGNCEKTEVKAFKEQTVTLPVPTKDGYIFTGWSADENAKSAEITHAAIGNTTLYALYAKTDTTVIYVDVNAKTNGNGASMFTPKNDWKSAMEAGNASGTTYVLMSSAIVSKTDTVGNGYAAAKGSITLTATDPATGKVYNTAAILCYNGHYSLKSVTYDIPIASIEHGTMHMNFQGNKTHFTKNARFINKGEEIPGYTDKDGNPVTSCSTIYMRGGNDNSNLDSTYIEYDNLDLVKNNDIYLASQFGGTINTVNWVINGGSIDKTIRINANQSKATANVGTLNVIVNGYTGSHTLSIGSTLTAFTGSLNVVLNNNSDVTVKYTGNVTPEKGTYIVKSSDEGVVEPTTTVGTFKITSTTGQIFINGTSVEIASDNLYALGEAGTYEITYDNTPRHKVTYDANGGSGTVADKTVKENSAIELPADVSINREGHTFLGWNTDKNATVALESLTMGTTDVVLYAIWEIDTYTVSFDANGGRATSELSNKLKYYNTDLTLPTDYVLYGTGLEFVGWSKNPDATAADVVTTYTENAPATFFAIYNNVGTSNVTPDKTDDELWDGTYFVIKESESQITAPESITEMGKVTEVSKKDISLIKASTGENVQPLQPLTFTIKCNKQEVENKIVYVYHVKENVQDSELLNTTVTFDENNAYVTFTTNSLSTFVIYTLEPQAVYSLIGQYNSVNGLYSVELYYSGDNANSGSFGFKYDGDVYSNGKFTYSDNVMEVSQTVHNTENRTFCGTWASNVSNNSASYIGGEEKTLIGTFTFTCYAADYDIFKAAERFFEYTTPNNFEITNETFNGQHYLYAVHQTASLPVEYAPITVFQTTDNEPITVTYKISGNYVTVREDGKAPVAFAKAVIKSENQTTIKSFNIESESTATGTVPFEFELSPGAYTVTFIKNGYLEETIAFTVANSDLELGNIHPIAGDIKGSDNAEQGDGTIDLADFARILRAFANKSLETACDVNEDGVVNVTDLGFVQANYGKKSK